MRHLVQTAVAILAICAVTAGRAEALTVREVIDLCKAGLGDEVLLALIDVDHSVFSIDPATLKQLKTAGVSDAVIVALIKSGRQARTEPAPQPAPEPQQDPAPRQREPEVIVIDHHDTQPAQPAPVAYPVAVPVYVPMYAPTLYGYGISGTDRVSTIVQTDQGYVKARVPVPPNCVRGQPVFWGFGGKLRPGSWDPPPTVVCR